MFFSFDLYSLAPPITGELKKRRAPTDCITSGPDMFNETTGDCCQRVESFSDGSKKLAYATRLVGSVDWKSLPTVYGDEHGGPVNKQLPLARSLAT